MTIFLVNVWFEEGPRGGSPAKDFRRSLTVRFRVVRVGQFCAMSTSRKRGAYLPVLSLAFAQGSTGRIVGMLFDWNTPVCIIYKRS